MSTSGLVWRLEHTPGLIRTCASLLLLPGKHLNAQTFSKQHCIQTHNKLVSHEVLQPALEAPSLTCRVPVVGKRQCAEHLPGTLGRVLHGRHARCMLAAVVLQHRVV
eukprot:1149709-Pelagomonas_calceolata.AAC.2